MGNTIGRESSALYGMRMDTDGSGQSVAYRLMAPDTVDEEGNLAIVTGLSVHGYEVAFAFLIDTIHIVDIRRDYRENPVQVLTREPQFGNFP